MTIKRALSIQQPYAERILRGTKRFEYRDKATNIRERVYIYASRKPGKIEAFAAMGLRPGDLPTELLVGTVEIVDCQPNGRGKRFKWQLARPERLTPPVKPEKRPLPTWFYPFGQ